MESMNSIAGYSYIPTQKSPGNGRTNTKEHSSYRTAVDTYTAGGVQTLPAASKAAPLTETLARSFAERYDVMNMDRRQYTRLLVDLRDAGVLPPWGFSAAYGGTMPSGNKSIFWPQGREKADFARLMRGCSQLCRDLTDSCASGTSEQANNKILAATYSHLEEIFCKIGDLRVAAPLTEEQQEVERLTALLKQDRAFSENPNRELMRHPGAQKLAAAMILADSSVQEKIARNLSVTIDKMKAMLRSPDPLTSAQVLLEYQHLLAGKAKAEGLTDTEKLLDSNLERADSMAQGTFHERMKWIQKEIEQAFQEKNLSLDPSKSYAFHLDPSNFTFSVTGGTEEENAVIADIVNASQNLAVTLTALSNHKGENGQPPQVSEEYASKMEKLIPASNQVNLDNYLKNRYGFGIDDLVYEGNYTIKGKTPEITKQIADLGMEFITFGGGSFISEIHETLVSRYGFGLNDVDFTEDGRMIGGTDEVKKIIAADRENIMRDLRQPPKIETPVFDGPVFTLENGRFQAVYG